MRKAQGTGFMTVARCAMLGPERGPRLPAVHIDPIIPSRLFRHTCHNNVALLCASTNIEVVADTCLGFPDA